MTPLGEAIDYDGLQAIMRSRAEQLNISREAIDRISGLPTGFAGKILSSAPVKRLGPDTIGPMLAALALKIVVVEDPEAFEKYAARVDQRDGKQAKNANASQASRKRILNGFLRGLASRGGVARATKLSPEHKKRISKIAANARWKKRRFRRLNAARS